MSFQRERENDRYVHDAIVQLTKTMEITIIYTKIRSAANQREKHNKKRKREKKTKTTKVAMLTRMLRMKPFSYTQHQPHFQTYRFIHLFGMYECATHKQTKTPMCAMLIWWIFVCRLIVWLLAFGLNSVWTMQAIVAQMEACVCIWETVVDRWSSSEQAHLLAGRLDSRLYYSCCYVVNRFRWWRYFFQYMFWFFFCCKIIFGTFILCCYWWYKRNLHTINYSINIHKLPQTDRSKVVDVHLIFWINYLLWLRIDLLLFRLLLFF